MEGRAADRAAHRDAGLFGGIVLPLEPESPQMSVDLDIRNLARLA
jgi:hypothetical protein